MKEKLTSQMLGRFVVNSVQYILGVVGMSASPRKAVEFTNQNIFSMLIYLILYTTQYISNMLFKFHYYTDVDFVYAFPLFLFWVAMHSVHTCVLRSRLALHCE